MKNYRKAFSLLEIFLVLVILGIIVAIFMPASIEIRKLARQEAISVNVEKIVQAGRKYNSDKTTSSVDFKTLIAEKYIKQPTLVAGESYENVIINSVGGVVVLKTELGDVVEIPYNF